MATLSDAEVCRRNGWSVGTYLRGMRYHAGMNMGETTIRITAIGESQILARRKGAVEVSQWNLGEWLLVEKVNGYEK